MPFVPDEFEPPDGLDVGPFRLTPLGPEHNDSDYAAWTSSMDHIHATPGFEAGRWPHEMTLEENRRDITEEVIRQKFPEGYTAARPYLRITPQPDCVAASQHAAPFDGG